MLVYQRVSFPIHQISWFYLSSQWKSPGPASKAMIPGASIREICTRNKRRDSINQSIDVSFIYRLICILYIYIMQPYVYIYIYIHCYIIHSIFYEIFNQYVGIVSMFIFVHLFSICIYIYHESKQCLFSHRLVDPMMSPARSLGRRCPA